MTTSTAQPGDSGEQVFRPRTRYLMERWLGLMVLVAVGAWGIVDPWYGLDPMFPAPGRILGLAFIPIVVSLAGRLIRLHRHELRLGHAGFSDRRGAPLVPWEQLDRVREHTGRQELELLDRRGGRLGVVSYAIDQVEEAIETIVHALRPSLPSGTAVFRRRAGWVRSLLGLIVILFLVWLGYGFSFRGASLVGTVVVLAATGIPLLDWLAVLRETRVSAGGLELIRGFGREVIPWDEIDSFGVVLTSRRFGAKHVGLGVADADGNAHAVCPAGADVGGLFQVIRARLAASRASVASGAERRREAGPARRPRLIWAGGVARAALLVIAVAVPPVLSLFEEEQERSIPELRALLASLPAPTFVVQEPGTTPLSLDPFGPEELLQYHRWLRTERFDSLEAALRVLRAQMAVDIRSEGRYVAAYTGLSHLGLRRAVDRWVEVHPDAPEARLVRAELLTSAAGQRRGGEASWMTSDQQFAAMVATQDSALTDLRVVLSRDPADIGAYWALLPIAQRAGAVDDIHVITARAVALAPSAYFVRLRAMLALLPRWGGSYEEMNWLAAEAQQYADQNPELRALHGFVDWDRANIAARRNDTAAAFRHARASLRHGETFRLCADHAARLVYYGRLDEAREAAHCAEALRPSYAETRALLGRMYLALSRRDHAAEGERYRALAETESKLALRLDSSDDDALRLGTRIREAKQELRTRPSPAVGR
jgi:hypothetical protein